MVISQGLPALAEFCPSLDATDQLYEASDADTLAVVADFLINLNALGWSGRFQPQFRSAFVSAESRIRRWECATISEALIASLPPGLEVLGASLVDSYSSTCLAALLEHCPKLHTLAIAGLTKDGAQLLANAYAERGRLEIHLLPRFVLRKSALVDLMVVAGHVVVPTSGWSLFSWR